MPTVDALLQLGQAMAEAMPQYLLSAQEFWSLPVQAAPGEPPFPNLSLASWYLTLDQLEAQYDEMDGAQQVGVAKLRQIDDGLRLSYAVALAAKGKAEAHQRLSLWGAYLAELEDGEQEGRRYATEVRQRVGLSRLLPLLEDQAARHIEGRLFELDERLRSIFQPGPFIWPPPLESIYPPPTYWFLYGSPAG
jgi:hypothetical protein